MELCHPGGAVPRQTGAHVSSASDTGHSQSGGAAGEGGSQPRLKSVTAWGATSSPSSQGCATGPRVTFTRTRPVNDENGLILRGELCGRWLARADAGHKGTLELISPWNPGTDLTAGRPVLGGIFVFFA